MSKRLLIALGFLAGCAAAPYNFDNLPLVWMPERQPSASAGSATPDLFKAKVKVAPMIDARKNPKLIGENREGSTPKPVTTSDDVAPFVTDHFKQLLSGAGLSVVDSGESVIIKGEITQFFVTETNLYSGEVRLDVVVTDRAGKSLWDGMTSGASDRFGRSYYAENYYQSLSDALSLATSSLLHDPSFQAAITRKR
jgi:hypothetical protein